MKIALEANIVMREFLESRGYSQDVFVKIFTLSNVAGTASHKRNYRAYQSAWQSSSRLYSNL